jgi:hypothetical protein
MLSKVAILVSLQLSLTSCGTKIILHPTYIKDGACEFKNEDICYPAKGYTAFSNFYLSEVMQVKIDNKR